MEARSQGIGTRHPLGMVYLCLYLLSISWSISFLFLLCISNQLCMHTNLAFSILGSAQVLCILSQSVHLYMQLPCCILEILFSWCETPSLVLKSFHSLFCSSWSFDGKSVICVFHFGLSTIFYPLNIDQMRLTLCTNCHLLQEEASLMNVERCTDICEYSNKSLELILILCLFGRILVIGSPLRPMIYLATCSWPTQLTIPETGFISWDRT